MAEVVSWDWKEQPDLDKLGDVIRRVSGGACDLRAIDTAGDDYAVVVSDHVMDVPEARELYLGEQDYDPKFAEESRGYMRAYWADRDAGNASG
jgi:hypothetical protein